MATDINVEALHVKRLNTILHGNPFGNQFSLESDSWSDLYKLVCNIDYLKNGGWVDSRHPHKKRGGHHHHKGNGSGGARHHHAHAAAMMKNPIVKLQIALLMRGTDADWQYKYRPQHVIHEELCMVLQKRAFCVTNHDTLHVQEIPVTSYKARNPNHVLVRELAFGPDSDPTVRSVSLWFTIQEEHVIMCTPQQAKRYRFKRSIKKENADDGGSSSSITTHNNSSSRGGKINNNGSTTTNNNKSVFDSLDSFAMIRPHDRSAFDLTTDMMKHRLTVLQTERISNMRERFEALKGLDVQRNELQMRFENLLVDWTAWAWPINKGRQHVTKKTPVPKVDGKYTIDAQQQEKITCSSSSGDGGGSEDVTLGKAVRPIWDSFVATNFNENLDDDIAEALRQFGASPDDKQPLSAHKLRIFETLARGMPVAFDRSLPHISTKVLLTTTNNNNTNNKQSGDEHPHSRQQERCWKALLLLHPTTSDNIGPHETITNEWNAVREHFANSRSKKVLAIIQQKK